VKTYANLSLLAQEFYQKQNQGFGMFLENVRIRQEKMDLVNQSVVKADAPRTRFVG